MTLCTGPVNRAPPVGAARLAGLGLGGSSLPGRSPALGRSLSLQFLNSAAPAPLQGLARTKGTTCSRGGALLAQASRFKLRDADGRTASNSVSARPKGGRQHPLTPLSPPESTTYSVPLVGWGGPRVQAKHTLSPSSLTPQAPAGSTPLAAAAQPASPRGPGGEIPSGHRWQTAADPGSSESRPLSRSWSRS